MLTNTNVLILCVDFFLDSVFVCQQLTHCCLLRGEWAPLLIHYCAKMMG